VNLVSAAWPAVPLPFFDSGYRHQADGKFKDVKAAGLGIPALPGATTNWSAVLISPEQSALKKPNVIEDNEGVPQSPDASRRGDFREFEKVRYSFRVKVCFGL
jgi:hypothetical protein